MRYKTLKEKLTKTVEQEKELDGKKRLLDYTKGYYKTTRVLSIIFFFVLLMWFKINFFISLIYAIIFNFAAIFFLTILGSIIFFIFKPRH